MAARVSKEKRDQFNAFMVELKNGTWIGLSEDDIADLTLEVDKLCQQKIKAKNDNARARAKAKEAPKEQLPEAPKKKNAKTEESAEAESSEAPATVKLVEGRKYEADENPKLGNAILEFTGETRGEDKAKFKILFKGDGDVPVGKNVILPIAAVHATKRRVPKAA